MGEEEQAEIERRLNALIRRDDLPEAEIAEIKTNVKGFGLVGLDTRLTSKRQGTLEITTFDKQIIQAARGFGEVVLIVLDHAGLFHGGDFNAREDVALTMRVVNHIATDTGAAVLLLAHSPKATAGAEYSDASQVAGSSAFVDQARGAMVLAGMREKEAQDLGIAKDQRSNYVSLAVVKNNYGPNGSIYWFKRQSFDGVGLLEHKVLIKPIPLPKGAAALEMAILNFIVSNPGKYSKTGLRDTRSGKDGPLKASKNKVADALENLLLDGRVLLRPPTEVERKKFSLGPRVTQVLALGENNASN
jgi:hypothetical protein